MPYILTGGGGGGGLHFRDPIDEFANTAARNTYFTTTDATAYLQFANDRSLAIAVGPSGGPYQFETYTGAPGSAYDDSAWLDRTDAIQGNTGAAGAQARFVIEIYLNSSTVPTAAPTGGSYVVDTGVLTPPTTPTGITILPETPATGERIYVAEAIINPLVDTGTVTPTWSEWSDLSHTTGGIGTVAHDASLTGEGTVALPLGVTNAVTANPVTAPTSQLDTIEIGSAIYNLDEVVDVTASRSSRTYWG